MEQINKDIPVPLYYQIAQQIRQQIESGELKVGDQIPTEIQLMEMYQVSRDTIRKAVSELVYDGLLERRRAKGTIVIRTKLEETSYNPVSFTQETMNRNLVLVSKILDCKIIPADADLADTLQVPEGSDLVGLARVRCINQEEVGIEDWYAALQTFPGLNRDYFAEEGIEQSTHYMLEKRYGISITRSADSISPVALEKEDAELLKVPKSTPALLRTRLTFMANGVPAFYVRGRYVITLNISYPSS